MCAPYITLNSNCRYKLKLVPGSLKKGRAAKSILNYFLTSKDINNLNEKKMIKSIPE